MTNRRKRTESRHTMEHVWQRTGPPKHTDLLTSRIFCIWLASSPRRSKQVPQELFQPPCPAAQVLWQVFLQHRQCGGNTLTCANNPSLTRITENHSMATFWWSYLESSRVQVLPKSNCPGELTTAQLLRWCCTSGNIFVRARAGLASS